ncbi:MAG TPA: glutamate-5-semialdehyde dehydrogenase, partial [Bacteroidota bacterium]
MEERIESQARSVKAASRILYDCPTAKKNRLLRAIISRLRTGTSAILAANGEDLESARCGGLSPVLLDRLTLNETGIRQVIKGVRDVIRLPDPVGHIRERVKRPNGLRVEKISVPLGAVGIIYEARPNVTIDASVLCLKSGNTVLLRGGSEALHTNKILADLVRTSLEDVDLPSGCVEFIDSTDRESVRVMLKQSTHLDVIIPRGSRQLIDFIRETSAVPVIAHGEGNCHVFVDSSADLSKAEEIVYNAKVQRPSVCNAAEKLLVHERIAPKFLPRIAKRLKSAGVELRCDDGALALIPDAAHAGEADWYTEYLDLIIAIKTVKTLSEAIDHINHYGSHHSDAIVTGSKANGERFLRSVDSAAVYVNASTRFTDGYEFGLGAEIGISTQKLHARGP